MVVLDASVINVAMPAIGHTYGVGQQALAWVVSAYVLAFGGFLLLGGRLADLLGRRRMFVAGLMIFGGASLFGGFADSIGILIAARVVQGLGAALLSPSAMSIIAVTFNDGAERNKAYAAWGAVGGAGGAAGVVLSGVLTPYAGWQWVLWINVPIVVVCVPLAFALLAESRAGTATRVFDLAGAVTVTAALTLLVYALIETWWVAIVSFVLFGIFVLIERRSSAPLVELAIFGNRTLTRANLAGILIGAALIPMFFFLSLYMQNVLHYDAITTGLWLVPMSLVAFGISLGLGSFLVTKLGYRPVLGAGMACLAIGLVWFAQASPHGSFLTELLVPSLIAGAGLGLAFPPIYVAAATGVDWQQAGLASGLINTSQQFGSALGLAALSTTLTTSYPAAFFGAAGFALLGLLLALIPARAQTRAANPPYSGKTKSFRSRGTV